MARAGPEHDLPAHDRHDRRHHRPGGSILGSSRTNPYRNPETDLAALRENFARLELDALIVIGGDDTLGVAIRLS